MILHIILICLLLLSICVVLAFYNGMSMEYSRKAWYLLGAIHNGKKAIIIKKIQLVSICAVFMAVLPWIFCSIGILRAFPMSELLASVKNIPAFAGFPINIPIACFVGITAAVQMFAVIGVGLAVLAISAGRKNDIQALFFSLLILVMPPVLKLMGFDFAGWLSVYPIYCGL